MHRIRTNAPQFLTLCIILILCGVHSTLNTQVYNYDYKEDKAAFIGSFIFWSGSYGLRMATPTERINDRKDLDKASLWAIDRGAVNQNSKNADHWSDVGQFGALATPVLAIVLSESLRSEAGPITLMGLQGFFISNGLTKYTKTLAERPRPFVYRQFDEHFNQPISKAATESFISGHTSSSAYFSFFAAKIIVDHSPDSNLKPLIWTIAAAIPALTGYLRYKAGKHFPTDIIAGYLVGAVTGFAIPEIYKNDRIAIGTESNGLSLSLVF